MNLLEGGKGGEGRMGERGWGRREGGEGTWGREGGWGEREGEAVLSGKYRGGISRAVFPGKYRPVQYPQSGKYREILGNINNLLVFCYTPYFLMVF